MSWYVIASFSISYIYRHFALSLYIILMQIMCMIYSCNCQADARFVWNAHLIRELTQQPELSRYCLPLMLGCILFLQRSCLTRVAVILRYRQYWADQDYSSVYFAVPRQFYLCLCLNHDRQSSKLLAVQYAVRRSRTLWCRGARATARVRATTWEVLIQKVTQPISWRLSR